MVHLLTQHLLMVSNRKTTNKERTKELGFKVPD